MIKGIIYRDNIYSQYLRSFIERGYNKVVGEFGGEPIEIVAYWIPGTCGNSNIDIPIIGTDVVRQLVMVGDIEVLIIPSENYIWQQDFLSLFMEIGIGLDNIYIANRLDREFNIKKDIIDMLTPYYSCRKLPYLEFHIADQCNLKCANCEHYSGLVKDPVFPDLKKFACDLKQLRNFFDEVYVFRILGGEPLLNPDIEKYIRLVNEVYPESKIHVVTNALLLKTMPDSFFDTLRDCYEGSGISISLYPVLREKVDELREFLDSKQISYEISDVIDVFRCQQKLERSNDEMAMEKYAHCYQKGCTNLYDGKLAACFLPFTTKYFNRYFDKSLPEDGAVDLYEDGLTTEKIRHRLSEPFERCRYCKEPIELPWHIIHEPSILEDWV